MIARLLLFLYRIKLRSTRCVIRWLIVKLEGGALYSPTIRKLFNDYYNIKIGMYSGGACFDIYMVDAFTTIGRYCSLAKGARIINHNHPLNFKGTSALFFNPAFGLSHTMLAKYTPLEIGNDVWIGANAVILPEVTEIGDGAVIGAGAVVNKNVPPYAIAVGNPARVIGYRFSEETIRNLRREQWWNKDIRELFGNIGDYQRPLE